MSSELVLIEQAGRTGPSIWGPLSVEMPSADRKLIRMSAIEHALPHIIERGRFSVRHHDQLVGEIVPLLQIDASKLPADPVRRAMVEELVKVHGGLPTAILEVTQAMAAVFPRLQPVVGRRVAFAGGHIYEDADNRTSMIIAKDVREGRLDSFSISGTSFRNKNIEWCDPTGCMMVEEVEEMDGSAITIGSSTGRSGSLFDAKTSNPGAAFVVVQQTVPCSKPELVEARVEFRLAHEANKFPSLCALRTLVQAGELETVLEALKTGGGNPNPYIPNQSVQGLTIMAPPAASPTTLTQTPAAPPAPATTPAPAAPSGQPNPEGIAEAVVTLTRRVEDMEKNQAQILAKVEQALKTLTAPAPAAPTAPTTPAQNGPAPGAAAEQAVVTQAAIDAAVAKALAAHPKTTPPTPAGKPARIVQTPQPAEPGGTGDSQAELKELMQAATAGSPVAAKQLIREITSAQKRTT